MSGTRPGAPIRSRRRELRALGHLQLGDAILAWLDRGTKQRDARRRLVAYAIELHRRVVATGTAPTTAAVLLAIAARLGHPASVPRAVMRALGLALADARRVDRGEPTMLFLDSGRAPRQKPTADGAA